MKCHPGLDMEFWLLKLSQFYEKDGQARISVQRITSQQNTKLVIQPTFI